MILTAQRLQFNSNLRDDGVNLLIIGNFRVTAGGEDIGSKSCIIRGPEKGLLKIKMIRPSLAKENRILEKYHL